MGLYSLRVVVGELRESNCPSRVAHLLGVMVYVPVMIRSSRLARPLVLVLVAAATLVIGVAGSPSGSVSATNQQRVTATSPTTGVTYTMIHSCMAQLPNATASTPDQTVSVQLETIKDGAVVA